MEKCKIKRKFFLLLLVISEITIFPKTYSNVQNITSESNQTPHLVILSEKIEIGSTIKTILFLPYSNIEFSEISISFPKNLELETASSYLFKEHNKVKLNFQKKKLPSVIPLSFIASKSGNFKMILYIQYFSEGMKKEYVKAYPFEIYEKQYSFWVPIFLASVLGAILALSGSLIEYKRVQKIKHIQEIKQTKNLIIGILNYYLSLKENGYTEKQNLPNWLVDYFSEKRKEILNVDEIFPFIIKLENAVKNWQRFNNGNPEADKNFYIELENIKKELIK